MYILEGSVCVNVGNRLRGVYVLDTGAIGVYSISIT